MITIGYISYSLLQFLNDKNFSVSRETVEKKPGPKPGLNLNMTPRNYSLSHFIGGFGTACFARGQTVVFAPAIQCAATFGFGDVLRFHVVSDHRIVDGRSFNGFGQFFQCSPDDSASAAFAGLRDAVLLIARLAFSTGGGTFGGFLRGLFLRGKEFGFAGFQRIGFRHDGFRFSFHGSGFGFFHDRFSVEVGQKVKISCHFHILNLNVWKVCRSVSVTDRRLVRFGAPESHHVCILSSVFRCRQPIFRQECNGLFQDSGTFGVGFQQPRLRPIDPAQRVGKAPQALALTETRRLSANLGR
nr:MAG TPA: hypothetical protein [Caudoviricetes sp.]